MAKRRTNGKDNLKSIDRDAFVVDDSTNEAWRATYDDTTHQKLDQINASLGGSSDTTATIYNISVATANSEISQVLPSNTKSFLIRSRNKGRLRLAYSPGGTSADYLTVPTGCSFKDTNFYSSISLYVQTTKPGDIIEIVAYT